MCAVIGYCGDPVSAREAGKLAVLMREGLARGTHATGWAWSDGTGKIESLKRIGESAADRAEFLLGAKIVVGHCRYSTSGDWREAGNNQPICIEGWSLAFNGVISMSTKEEFERQFQVTCQSDNDGEVFLRRVERGDDPASFLRRSGASFAGCWTNGKTLWALRNWKRPLWRWRTDAGDWFASTRDIFERSGLLGSEELRPETLFSKTTK